MILFARSRGEIDEGSDHRRGRFWGILLVADSGQNLQVQRLGWGLEVDARAALKKMVEWFQQDSKKG